MASSNNWCRSGRVSIQLGIDDGRKVGCATGGLAKPNDDRLGLGNSSRFSCSLCSAIKNAEFALLMN